jgi:hypothetical protein
MQKLMMTMRDGLQQRLVLEQWAVRKTMAMRLQTMACVLLSLLHKPYARNPTPTLRPCVV